jgi:hypothetical protein
MRTLTGKSIENLAAEKKVSIFSSSKKGNNKLLPDYISQPLDEKKER